MLANFLPCAIILAIGGKNEKINVQPHVVGAGCRSNRPTCFGAKHKSFQAHQRDTCGLSLFGDA